MTNPKDIAGGKKVPLHLNPPIAAVYQAMAQRDGAVKYGPYNWRDEKIHAMQYVSAMLRHIHAWMDGEEMSPDTDPPVHHLGHVMATAAILLDARAYDCLVDDRPDQAGVLTGLHKHCAELIAEKQGADSEFAATTFGPLPE